MSANTNHTIELLVVHYCGELYQSSSSSSSSALVALLTSRDCFLSPRPLPVFSVLFVMFSHLNKLRSVSAQSLLKRSWRPSPSSSSSSSGAVRALATVSNSAYDGNNVLAIVREDFSMWERRSPLCPHHVSELSKQGFKVLVQPCNKRVFTNKEYAEAGGIVQEDISDASLLLGVKQMPLHRLNRPRNYLFFSHVIKAQPGNMPMLDHINETQCRLFDYECITKDGKDGAPRLVAFGKYAGIAGMIDGLQGLGQRLLAEGFSTPFLNVPTSHMYQNLDHARYTLRNVGAQIQNMGMPENLSPVVFAFTGNGNVSKGAQEMFKLLPHEYIDASELATLENDIRSGKRSSNKLYGVELKVEDMFQKKDGTPLTDPSDYFAHAENYKSIFATNILPHITFLANCIYWDFHCPRIITKEEIRSLRATGNKKFKFLSDISCDVGGSVEFLSKCTSIEKPFYNYVPETDTDVDDGLTDEGIGILSVEILPTELPRDSSEHFGNALMPLIPPLVRSPETPSTADNSVSSIEEKQRSAIESLPLELQRACIASHGELLPKWKYIERLRASNNLTNEATGADGISILNISGHLFDSGLINKILDELEVFKDIKFSLTNCDVRPNQSSGPLPSRIEIHIEGPKDHVTEVCEHITELIDNFHDSAEATIYTSHSGDMDGSTEKFSPDIRVTSPKRVVVLGSGRVVAPVIKILGSHENVHITVASDSESQSKDLISMLPQNRGSYAPLIMGPNGQGTDMVNKLVRGADLVISLLPATMHMLVADAAIAHKKHMVTASYVSDAMREINQDAINAGISIVNEVGLDPGIDHMLIMKSIDDIHGRGGKVTELVSLCGGLPDPVAADNPLRYKFSWSPKGVLSAAGNAAKYLVYDDVVEIAGGDLLLSGEPTTRFPTMRLEVLPNRNSLLYRDLYNIPYAHSVCRGTLRYEGWSNIMYALRVLGVFDESCPSAKTFVEFLAKKLNASGSKDIMIALSSHLQAGGVRNIPSAIDAIVWLGLLDSSVAMSDPSSPLESMCSLLTAKLQFTESEKDMVAMYHSVVGVMSDGTTEIHSSRLLAFGTPGINGETAMAATVGYTTGAAAELILNGQFSRPGVSIPTTPDLYDPILRRIQNYGIHWTEDVKITK